LPPSAAICSAVAFPIPEVEPVTIQTLSENRIKKNFKSDQLYQHAHKNVAMLFLLEI
jgi:hypothetical protein